MLRITAGRFKGRPIPTVKDNAVRPTTGRVRESVFQILGNRLTGAVFLDIFAGSGLMGFEALSRDAARVVAIEQNPTHRALILKNAETLGVTASEYNCILGDAFAVTAKTLTPEQLSGGADVVFIDPPFKMLGIEAIVESVFSRGLVKPGGIVVWEYPARVPPKPLSLSHVACIDTRHYGDASVAFYAFSETPE